MRKEKIIPIIHNKEHLFYTEDDLNYALSFNADYTVISSIRNLGKSYSAMQLTKKKIESGKTILWERYNRDEFRLAKKTLENFFQGALGKPYDAGGYIEYEHDSGGKLLMCQTSVINIKGYDDIYDKLPVFEIKDEFLPVKYTNQTRFFEEYRDAMEIRKTFKRNGPMRSIYLSNCLNWMNPYTVAWGLMPIDSGFARLTMDTFTVHTEDEDVSATRTIFWENVKPTKAQIKRVINTEVTSMNVDSLDKYIDNEFYKEYSKIAKCPDLSIPLEPVQLMSENYFIGFRIFEGRYYFTNVKPKEGVLTYVSEKAWIDLDKKFIRYPQYAMKFEEKFNAGICVYDSTKTFMAYQRWLVNNRKR